MEDFSFILKNIDETEDSLQQRSQLLRIREFLIEYHAEPDLVDAVGAAIEDIELWIDPEIESAFRSGLLISGEA